ncbi:hypothetical protein B4099_2945 [Heyndrickxia coagulans]|uniref:Uncharacterized protein n=1 Tax=Heyndrickxia coagulans TaxID=1398 RepID=A0A150KFV9_HEYCO|nr:hypothetical protein B4099_2945 [Heyndrickxia coagulans]
MRAFRGTDRAGIKISLFRAGGSAPVYTGAAGFRGYPSKNAPGKVSRRTSTPGGQMIRQIAAI